MSCNGDNEAIAGNPPILRSAPGQCFAVNSHRRQSHRQACCSFCRSDARHFCAQLCEMRQPPSYKGSRRPLGRNWSSIVRCSLPP